jgi:hypothetical protein
MRVFSSIQVAVVLGCCALASGAAAAGADGRALASGVIAFASNRDGDRPCFGSR